VPLYLHLAVHASKCVCQAVEWRKILGQFEFMSLSDLYAKICVHINPVMFWAINQTCPLWTCLLNLKTCGLSTKVIANREISDSWTLKWNPFPQWAWSRGSQMYHGCIESWDYIFPHKCIFFTVGCPTAAAPKKGVVRVACCVAWRLCIVLWTYRRKGVRIPHAAAGV